MFFKNEFPILEFDDNKVAKLNPSALFEKKNPEKKMIITFFPEVLEKLKEEKLIEKAYYIGGENPFDIYRFVGSDILIVLGQVGCPACAGNLDCFYAMGVEKVMFCGGGGVHGGADRTGGTHAAADQGPAGILL